MNITRKFIYTAVGVILSGTTLSSCRKAPTNTSTSGLATIVCDATFENIMNQEIDVFEYTTKGNASIIPYYVSEKDAVDSLLDMNTKTIVIPRELTQKEKDYLVAQKKNPRCNRIGDCRDTGGQGDIVGTVRPRHEEDGRYQDCV